MTAMLIVCPQCNLEADLSARAVNRARKGGANIYCGPICANLARRVFRSDAEKRQIKSEYDRQYRAKNIAKLTAQKAARFQATYDPAAAAVERKKRMPYHVEYCQQPEYRAYKQQYDRQYRAKDYGEFAEAYLAVVDLDREIKQRSDFYERAQQKGTVNKTIRRKRAAAAGTVAVG